jgi:quinoprotein glucose dehydrogenase
MKIKTALIFTLICLILLISSLKIEKLALTDGDVDWAEYLGGADRNHYSTLSQITAENVQNLKIAWSYEMPDSGQMQVNPLIVDGVVYGVTPSVQAFALNAATGKEIWRFGDPLKAWHSTSRGVSYWQEGDDKRILHTIGSHLYAIDAHSGKSIPSFGDNGRVDLHTGLPDIAKDKFIVSNTPGTIFEDLIIMPVRLSEGADAAPGDIRAFNVKTGQLAWSFHTIPHPGEEGYETFPPNAYKNEDVGAANNWSGMAVDKKRGIVYVPTGSAGYDFYGGSRTGQNLYANCLLALDARTGKRKWHFQTMHHDIWDRDLPAPPNLVTVKKDGKMIDAVAQVSKQGYVYVFDRETGTPIFPIKEVKAPKSALAGEITWATQPLPTKPAPFARQAWQLTERDINPYAENKAELLEKFKKYKTKRFAPPSAEGTVILPGFDGGAEWGGSAVDPNGIIYINSNEMPWILTMVEAPKMDNLAGLPMGEKLYITTCQVCHGANKMGNPLSNVPALVDIGKKLNRKAIGSIIANGKGRMPGFSTIQSDDQQAVISYLLGEEKKEVSSSTSKNAPKTPYMPYVSTGYNKFLDNKGHPAIKPPWGTLNALDLNTGKYLWQIPFGDEPNFHIKGTGTENYGGPIITASGLLFIAATKDEKFRCYEAKTGKLLWETTLPAASFATPSTYSVGGKQYIVLACGGTKLGTKKGNTYVAFALH